VKQLETQNISETQNFQQTMLLVRQDLKLGNAKPKIRFRIVYGSLASLTNELSPRFAALQVLAVFQVFRILKSFVSILVPVLVTVC
jgi:hypothetical protein